MVLPKKSTRETLDGEHQLYLDLANLLPAKARDLFVRSSIESAMDSRDVPPSVRAMVTSITHDPTVALPLALGEHFAGEEFAAFRRYLLEPDPRWPDLITPRQRWDFLVMVSEELNRRMGYRVDAPLVRWFRGKAEMWKPDRACVICDKLFAVTRKDKTTCSDQCANVKRQRDFQNPERAKEREERAKQYAEAKKLAAVTGKKRARRKKRKKG